MNGSSRNLIVILVAVGIALIAAELICFQPNQKVPTAVIGRWTGTADQSGETYPVVMTIGSYDSNIVYPSLRCGGHVTFVRKFGGALEFRETLDHGLNDCIQGGTIIMKLIDRDTAEWRWLDPDHKRSENVRSTLHRDPGASET